MRHVRDIGSGAGEVEDMICMKKTKGGTVVGCGHCTGS